MAGAQNESSGGNPFIELIINVIAPAMILKKLSRTILPPDASPEAVLKASEGFFAPFQMEPTTALLVALALPIGYGIYDFAVRRKVNFFSVLGFISTLLTGTLALLKTDAIWFAVKEAAIPLLFGAATLISLKFGKPLVRVFLFNPQVMETEVVDEILERDGKQAEFHKLLVHGSLLLGVSFVLSAVLNFFLAIILLKSEPGSSAFNDELGSMQLLSFPVIMLPCMVVTLYAFFKMMKGIKALTGLELEDLMRQKHKKEDEPFA